VEAAGSQLNLAHLPFGSHGADRFSVQRNIDASGIAEAESHRFVAFDRPRLVRIERPGEDVLSVGAGEHPDRLVGGHLHADRRVRVGGPCRLIVRSGRGLGLGRLDDGGRLGIDRGSGLCLRLRFGLGRLRGRLDRRLFLWDRRRGSDGRLYGCHRRRRCLRGRGHRMTRVLPERVYTGTHEHHHDHECGGGQRRGPVARPAVADSLPLLDAGHTDLGNRGEVGVVGIDRSGRRQHLLDLGREFLAIQPQERSVLTHKAFCEYTGGQSLEPLLLDGFEKA